MKGTKIIKFMAVLIVISMLLSMIASCEYVPGSGTTSDDKDPQNNQTASSERYTRCDADGNADENGMYIIFGEYPQTIKADDVSITSITDERGYYLGSDDCYYAAITATPAYDSIYDFSTGDVVTSGVVYYFKVEPIRWRILSENGESAFILCDSIIDSMAYQHDYDVDAMAGFTTTNNGAPEGTFANNYMYSEVRRWLNEDFYKNTFSEIQREFILLTSIDNSVGSTGYGSSDPFASKYVCENTSDKIFLLSFAEAINSEYGFLTDKSEADEVRKMKTSDYSRAKGIMMNDSTLLYSTGYWWLRSPINYGGQTVQMIHPNGRAFGSMPIAGDIYRNSGGIVPAMWINLET